MATKTEMPNCTTELSAAHMAELQQQKAAVAPKKRKTTPKKLEDAGLLATLGQLLCDHQIGTYPCTWC
jgi:acyl-CoA-dependent ceramide synthase